MQNDTLKQRKAQQKRGAKLWFDISQARDKSEPTSVPGVTNVTVSQDAELDTLPQNCGSYFQAGGKPSAKLPAANCYVCQSLQVLIRGGRG